MRQTSIGTFVTALNGLITSIQSLTSYDPTTQTAGPLLGNATLQSFQNQLSKILDQVQSGNAAGAATSLASIGISASPDGSYSTNSTKLGNSLTGNLSAITSLFGGPTGIATQLNTLISQYTQAGGLLDSINQGLQSSLSDVAQQQTAAERAAGHVLRHAHQGIQRHGHGGCLAQADPDLSDGAVQLEPRVHQLVIDQQRPRQRQSEHRRLKHHVRTQQGGGAIPRGSQPRLGCRRQPHAAGAGDVRTHSLSSGDGTRLHGPHQGNRPLNDVVAKGKAISKTLALLGQLSGTLDMERGGQVAQNLRALYEYMMNRLALANGTNDVTIVAEVSALVEEIKSGWDQIVSDER